MHYTQFILLVMAAMLHQLVREELNRSKVEIIPHPDIVERESTSPYTASNQENSRMPKPSPLHLNSVSSNESSAPKFPASPRSPKPQTLRARETNLPNYEPSAGLPMSPVSLSPNPQSSRAVNTTLQHSTRSNSFSHSNEHKATTPRRTTIGL